MTDISTVIEQLWAMFTDLFYLTLHKYDEVVVFHAYDGEPVSLLDFSIAIIVLGIVLSVILGIRYTVDSQNDVL